MLRVTLFCDWFLKKFNSDPDFIDNLLVSDESTFCFDGHVSSQNCRIWGLENHHAVRESTSFSPKLTIWVAMSSQTLIGPYVFREDRDISCIVDAERYIEMLHEYFLPGLPRQGVDLQSIYFQQDLATPHTSHRVWNSYGAILEPV